MSIELKIKAKSLAAEARIIKQIEHKAKYRFERQKDEAKKRLHREEFTERLKLLRTHRTHDVRKQARSTHLARAYLKGKPYNVVENYCHEAPCYKCIAGMVRRYGGDGYHNTTPETIEAWTWQNSRYEFDRWSWAGRPSKGHYTWVPK